MKRKTPYYLIVFGILIILFQIVELAFFVYIESGTLSNGEFLLGVVTTVVGALGISYSGYWLGQATLSPSRYPRITWWCVSGAVVFTLFNGALIANIPSESWEMVVAWVRWAVVIGASTGLLVGILEGRAIHEAIAAERAIVRSEQLEEQRDMLDYLNSILRHEVLNAANIISGYTSLLLERESELDEDSKQMAKIIREESEDMSTIIDDVRILLARTSGDHELHRVNLTEMLTEEVRKVTNRHDSVDVQVSIPDHVFVYGDRLLSRVFENLLSNAVKHNDVAEPTVSVSVTQRSDTVQIQIEDNGTGILEGSIDSLFERRRERGSTHGLGLYLSAELVKEYDGTIELTETGPTGSAFTVELPRNSEPQDAVTETNVA